MRLLLRVLLIIRDKYTRERLSLESSRDSLHDELHSAHKQLDVEMRWKDMAESNHRRLLEEKTQLMTRYVYMYLHTKTYQYT